MKRIPVIVGPTGSGKTTLALKICHEIDNCAILSADSRQIYKFMDIGTGKCPVDNKGDIVKGDGKWIIDGIEIWGYDITAPDKSFSSYDFALYGLKKINSLLAQKGEVVIAGGTGFYIDALTGKTKLSEVRPDPELRDALNQQTLEELQNLLKALNLETYTRIDIKNKLRIIRAVEREQQKEILPTPLPYFNYDKYVYIGLNAPREFLYEKSDNWVENIWSQGLVEEVEALIDRGYENSPRLKGLVYKTVCAYIKDEFKEEEAKQRIKFDIHAYIRRQLTWFRKNPDIAWYDVTQVSLNKLASEIISGHLI